MKPLKLVISAFGSYAGKEMIDFGKIGQGIFLITGDTGAGKTTIFDAVSFALYGDLSGAGRDSTMMRSQYAGEGEETYIELTFSEKNDIYIIRRSPLYYRMSKRKNKNGENTLIQSSAKASLFLPDGTEYPGNIRDINRKIQEITEVDREQFSQIAMIAQGEYIKLLHASSKERKEIFSRIFNTAVYQKIQLDLRDRDKVLYGKLEDGRKLCIHELDKVIVNNDSAYKEIWEETKKTPETGMNEILSVLEDVIQESKAKEKWCIQESEALRKDISSLEYEWKTRKENNLLLEKRDESECRWKRLKGEEERFEQVKEQIDAAERAVKGRRKEEVFLKEEKNLEEIRERLEKIRREKKSAEEMLENTGKKWDNRQKEIKKLLPEITEEIGELRRAGMLYKALEENMRLTEKKKKEEGKAWESFEEKQSLWEEWKKKTAELYNEETELLESPGKYAEWKQKIQELALKKEKLEKLIQLEKDVGESKEKWLAGGEALAEADKNYRKADREHERLYRKFIAAQAGIMASVLQEGEECPVCGSRSHPKKAELFDGTVTEEQVTAAKLKKEKADGYLRMRAEEAGRAESIYISRKKILEDMENEMKVSGLKAGESMLKNCMEEEKKASLQAGKYGKEEERFRQIREELTKREESRENFEGEVKALEKEWKERAEEKRALQVEGERLGKEVPFPEKAEADKRLERLEREKGDLEKEEQEWTRKEKKCSEDVREKNGKLQVLLETEISCVERVKQARQDYMEEVKKQGFESAEDCQKAFLPSNVLNSCKEELNRYRLNLIQTETSFRQYEEQTKGKEKKDTKDLEIRIQGSQEKERKIQEKLSSLSGVRSCNEGVKKEIRKQMAAREKLEKEFRTIHLLYQTANGKLPGTAGLDFQTYIQRCYFRQMVHMANKRLSFMANGRFLLKCRDMGNLGRQGEVGLDLDIYSLETDRIRDVKTLSGGESFMAALSMALGMADIIQNTAGKIHLDTMFIDEGFGSLDEESRIRAIQVLQSLAGEKRMIGIISHVTELKEQMDRKLIVWKDERGSHIRWEDQTSL